MTSLTPIAIVTDFLGNLSCRRVDAALEHVDENIDYVNVSLPAVRGKKRFGAVMRALNSQVMGFDAEMLNISADEQGVVLNERLDELTIGPLRMQFWVCGRFEIREGRITVWRDYFDYFDITKALLRGIVAIPFPKLQPPLAGSMRDGNAALR